MLVIVNTEIILIKQQVCEQNVKLNK